MKIEDIEQKFNNGDELSYDEIDWLISELNRYYDLYPKQEMTHED